jgi:hypothetical protein
MERRWEIAKPLTESVVTAAPKPPFEVEDLGRRKHLPYPAERVSSIR